MSYEYTVSKTAINSHKNKLVFKDDKLKELAYANIIELDLAQTLEYLETNTEIDFFLCAELFEQAYEGLKTKKMVKQKVVWLDCIEKKKMGLTYTTFKAIPALIEYLKSQGVTDMVYFPCPLNMYQYYSQQQAQAALDKMAMAYTKVAQNNNLRIEVLANGPITLYNEAGNEMEINGSIYKINI